MAEPVKAMGNETASSSGQVWADALHPALRRLDRLLRRAVAAMQSAVPEAAADPYRGLYIADDEVARLLAREPAAPGPDQREPSDDRADAPPRLHWLAQTFGLSRFDLDLILIALAPELDLRYERVYAYLQDDVTRRRPSVEFALNLLCRSPEDRLAGRQRLTGSAPLRRHSLLHVFPDPAQFQPPLLAHYLKLDEQVVGWLLGQLNLDGRLTPFCELLEPSARPAELTVRAELQRAQAGLVARAQSAGRPLRLYFHGPSGVGKRRAAHELASDIGAPLVVVDLARALVATSDFEQTLTLLFRESRCRQAVLYLGGVDALLADERRLQYESLMAALAAGETTVVLAGRQPWAPAGPGRLGVIQVPFPFPKMAERRACWQRELAEAGWALDQLELEALAGRFRLTPEQIVEAVAAAGRGAEWRATAQPPDERRRSAPASRPTLRDLFSAARAQSGHHLATLTRKIEPKYVWADMVLPTDQLTQLSEICDQVRFRQVVFGAWGFDHKLSHGKGLSLLFAGPPGTGKTMAAEVVSAELQLDLYKINLSQVVSKYIGETEKNLDRIFTAAENANAILFFDEADALFGKRSEVKDAHDRYANIEISYLLQKMEEYGGIAILATNLRQHLDEAFVRRLQVAVEFPFPDETHRRRIWESIFPAETPRGADVDVDRLAREIKLAGGNIKNIALAAAFYAAADDGVVGMPHLARAARREYQKLGRSWDEPAWSIPAALTT